MLGPPRIEDEGQPCPPPRGLKSWAVLARVALAGRPVGRRELAGELFGEADDPLGALRWSLADLRRSFGLPSLLCGDPLSLAPGELWVDVRALEDGSLPVEDVGAELLEGIELRNCPGFDTWLLLARLDCTARGRQELRRRAPESDPSFRNLVYDAADMVEKGLMKREYRDHRLEWMIKIGGMDVITKGLERDNIRFGPDFN